MKTHQTRYPSPLASMLGEPVDVDAVKQRG